MTKAVPLQRMSATKRILVFGKWPLKACNGRTGVLSIKKKAHALSKARA